MQTEAFHQYLNNNDKEGEQSPFDSFLDTESWLVEWSEFIGT
jgi:hypothetical protein